MTGLDPSATLRARAELLARPAEEPERAAVRELLVVSVDGRRFGVDADRVQRILQNRGLCRLPGSCGELVGLAPAQDAVVPVADLASVLGGRGDPERPFVVLLGDSQQSVGFFVDDAESVIAVPEGDVLPREGDIAAHGPERAITRDGVVVLDADQLLSDPRLTTHHDQEVASSRLPPGQETHGKPDDR